MATLGSTGSIQDSSTEYELIQPRDERLRRGHSIRIPPHMKLPPPHLPPTPPSRQLQSSGRQRLHRLSNSRQRNYAGLHGARDAESDYAIPNARKYTASNAPSHNYDGFFHGSIDERNDEDGIGQSLVSEPGQNKPRHCCKSVMIKNALCFITLATNVLISLAALGLVLYIMFGGDSTITSSHDTECSQGWCAVTVTMAAVSGTNCTQNVDNSMCCTTESLNTNITVSCISYVKLI